MPFSSVGQFVVRRKWIDEHAYADLVGLWHRKVSHVTLAGRVRTDGAQWEGEGGFAHLWRG